MRKIFQKIFSAVIAVGTWVWNIVLDISTFLREGGKDSAYSSKRICGVCLILAGIKLLFVGMATFQSIISNGWYAVLVFVPALLCFIIAAFFFYINGKIDISTAIDKVKEIAESVSDKKHE